MPTAVETPVRAYAHCNDHTCPGYVQAEVDGILNVTTFRYMDAGSTDGMAGFPERSMEYLRFAFEGDSTCEICHGPRGISQQERPEYPKYVRTEREQPQADANVFKMMLDMKGELAELRAEKAAAESKRGPGRPPKQVVED